MRNPDRWMEYRGEAMDEEVFRDALNMLRDLHRINDAKRGNPYHNLLHNDDVATRFGELLVLAGYPRAVVQAGVFAALAHDLGHPGVTLRWMAGDVPEPYLTNEAYAVKVVKTLAAEVGFAATLLDLMEEAIIGSTFGVPYEPTTRVQKLMAIADLASFADGFDKWIVESARVLQEQPQEKRPTNVKAMLEGQLAFLTKFVATRMTPEAHGLWDHQFAAAVETLKTLLTAPENDPVLARVTALVAPHLRTPASAA